MSSLRKLRNTIFEHFQTPSSPPPLCNSSMLRGLCAALSQWTTPSPSSIYRQSLVKIPPIKNTLSNNTLHIFHPFYAIE